MTEIREQKAELVKWLNGATEYISLIKNFDDKDMLKIWQQSLVDNEPAYHIYNDNFFLVASFECWKKYSKKYIKMLFNNKQVELLLNECNHIIDLGNGLGYSTRLINELAMTKVSCIQLANTEQYRYNEMLKNNLTELDQEEQVDCFVAFDFMEHLYEPIKYLDELFIKKPKLIILANSFGTEAVGHFKEYLVDDKLINEKKIGRLFNSHLRKNGFEKLKLNFWNDRPCVWKIKNDL